MNENINDSKNPLQGLSEGIERFVVFRFGHGLGKSIKNRIKSFGCQWNVLHQGWLCTYASKDSVQKAIHDANLECTVQLVSLPKGTIPKDPRVSSRKTCLEILEEQYHKNSMQLLGDVHRYDDTLRPEDFLEPPRVDENSAQLCRMERDFHERVVALQKDKIEIEKARSELSHLTSDSGDKVFDPEAPLLLAEALLQKEFYKQDYITLQHCSDTFFQWDGIKYVELNKHEMRQRIYNFMRDAKAINNAGYLENYNPSKCKVDLVVDALCAIRHHNHHPSTGAFWLDQRKLPNPKSLISFPNGLLNIEEWLKTQAVSLLPHTPILMNVNSLTFDFDPKASEPSEWLKFLQSIWPDDIESQQSLQEWMGYLLVNDTSHHKILLIVGPSRSGKGTIGHVMLEMLGTFNVVCPILSSLNGEFGLQPFLNKTLALISDARLNSKGNNSVIIERLLSISGEDPLTINRKYLSPLTAQLRTRIVLMSNELPDLRDASGALSKRYLVLKMTKSWLGKEDTSLLSKLKAELPGIVLWALQGLLRLRTRGRFAQPQSASQMIEELEALSSPIKAFVSEKCDIKPEALIPIATLFGAWCNWCDENGHSHPGTVQSFGKILHAAIPDIGMIRLQENQNRERYYTGIILV